MSTRRAVTLIACIGVVIAAAVAAWLHATSPKDVLLYTPPAGVPPHYTRASALGFSLTILALLVLSLLACAGSAFLAWKGNKAWTSRAKATGGAAIVFTLLLVLASLTERYWP